MIVPAAPAGHDLDSHARLLEVDQPRNRLGVSDQLGRERVCERGKGAVARRREDDPPARRRARSEPRAQERALAGARWTDQREQMRPPQLLPHLLDLELAADEVVRVPSVNDDRPGYGRCDSSPARRRVTSSSARDSAAAVEYRCSRASRHRLPEHGGPRRVVQPRRPVVDGAPDRFARRWVPCPTGRDHLCQHDARREHVGPGVDDLSARLLQRHVGRRARNRPAARRRHGAGDAKIHDHDATGARDHHVLRLDVAVHEPGGVDRLEPGQELRGDLAGLLEIQRASLAQQIGQGHPVDELHRHQLTAVELDQVEDAADVRRDDLACRADFLPQAVEGPLVGEQRHPHRLERDIHPQLEIEGAKNLAHAAAAEQRADAIAFAEHLARSQRVDGQDGRQATTLARLRFRCRAQSQIEQARQAEPGRPLFGAQPGAAVGTAPGSVRVIGVRGTPERVARSDVRNGTAPEGYASRSCQGRITPRRCRTSSSTSVGLATVSATSSRSRRP